MTIVENAFEFLEELFPAILTLINRNQIIEILVFIPIVGLGVMIFRLLFKIFGYKKVGSDDIIDD